MPYLIFIGLIGWMALLAGQRGEGAERRSSEQRLDTGVRRSPRRQVRRKR